MYCSDDSPRVDNMAASLEYFSSACNRTPHAVSWSPRGCLAFATDKSIAIAEFIEGGANHCRVLHVTCTLHGHTERVNCVQWLTYRGRGSMGGALPLELISGGVDKTIRIWQKSDGHDDMSFQCVDVLSSHNLPVTCLASTHVGVAGGAWLFSSGTDSQILIWKRVKLNESFVCHQSISIGRSFIFGIDCYHMTSGIDSKVILCLGGDDGKVNLFVQQDDDVFIKVFNLLGHEDWIRDVHFTNEGDGRSLLLASCSQDTYIRLWRIKEDETTPTNDSELRVKGNYFTLDVIRYVATLEAVLSGHEDWVYSCQWSPASLTLLTASMDKTMLLWEPDPVSGVWLERVRIGDVGGNTMGLYGAHFHPSGAVVVAHGYQGSFHLWGRANSNGDDGDSRELWKSLTAPSGHFESVQDCCWDPDDGRYLLSISNDQTSRLHGCWLNPSGNMSWHELARPQVHGYDIQCVAFISSLHFASGADEKVVRVFQAPQNFVDNFKRISGMDFHCQSDSLPLGATTPALGLSNKAIYNTTSTHDDDDGDSSQSAQSVKNSFTSEVPVFAPVDLFEPPIEEYLLQNTLWPETQKLYGHGYEIYCVAANGRLLASACKASKVEHAVIRVWSVGSWQQIGSLSAHSLTVTQLSFSPDETMLLAVSRDRTWSLWNMTKEPFSLIAVMDKSTKAHSRIIWSCSWTHDSQSFATGSRDKKVCFWSKSGNSNDVWGLAGRPLECPQPVTAVDFSPKLTSCDKYLLAIGLENGEITFSLFSHPDEKWSPLIKIHPFLCHTSIVHRIRWQPSSTHSNRSAATGLLLASCSHDNSVRILRFNTQSITT